MGPPTLALTSCAPICWGLPNRLVHQLSAAATVFGHGQNDSIDSTIQSIYTASYPFTIQLYKVVKRKQVNVMNRVSVGTIVDTMGMMQHLGVIPSSEQPQA